MPLNAKLKRALKIAGIAAVVGFAVLNFVAYRQAYAMTHFVAGGKPTGKPEDLDLRQKLKALLFGIDLPRPRATIPFSKLGFGSRSLTIPEAGGIHLGAWYCPAPTNGPLAILFHGYNGEKSSLLEQARVFQELGFAVLLVDFRGSGESSESYTTVGHAEGEDVAAAVTYANASLPHSKLVLYGISMGAASILAAADRYHLQPDAIICEAVFDKMLTTVRHRFELMGVPSFPGAQLLVFWGGRQFGFNGFANNPVDFAATVRCPILFLHGSADPRATLSEGRAVYNAVPGKKAFKEFPGIAHASIVNHKKWEWKQTVRQFLKDNGVECF